MDHMQHHDSSGNGASSRWKWAVLGFLAVAGFFLWTEHQAHVLGVLPYLLVLACPLMHLFHHGHGGHRHGSAPSAQSSTGRLAKSEEHDSVADFGAAYADYRRHAPAFIASSGKYELQHHQD